MSLILRANATIVFAIGASAFPCYAALAGSCVKEITKLEHAMNASVAEKEGGTAHQSRDANLPRQPTPRSVAREEEGRCRRAERQSIA